MVKKLYLLLVVALALASSTAAFAAGNDGYWTKLNPLNNSGANGNAKVWVDGNQIKVSIQSDGLSADLPHAQHIHFGEEARKECPTNSDDKNNDGLITTTEGVPAYGPVQVSLTTKGDVSPTSGLAVDRFPVATSNGNVTYTRTFDVPANFSVNDLKSAVIVQHGISETTGDKTKYDGAMKSDLDPNLPEEATTPATCGALQLVSMPQTGAGGMANNSGSSIPVAGLALLGATLAAGAVLVARRRSL